jgi:MFS family permease
MKSDHKVSNYWLFDSQLLTSFTSSLYVAGFVTSFFASYVTRVFGRKPSIVAGGTAFLAGTTLGAAAFNVYMLIVGRLMLGVGVGFANQVANLFFFILVFSSTYRKRNIKIIRVFKTSVYRIS